MMRAKQSAKPRTAVEIHKLGNLRAVQAAMSRRAGLKLAEIAEKMGGLHVSTIAALAAKGERILSRRVKQ